MTADMGLVAQQVARRLVDSVELVRPHFPFAAPPGGSWITLPDGGWAAGYWVGALRMAAACGDEPNADAAADEGESRLRGQLQKDTVLRGMVFYYGCVSGWRLLGHHVSRDLALRAAETLAATRRPSGVLASGTQRELATGDGLRESNIDSVPAIALISWAAAESQDARLRAIALDHYDRHIQGSIRSDGSVHQVIVVDDSGSIERGFTYRGLAEDSVWSRGQAWAVLGFALGHMWLGEPRLLEAATKTADWWIDSLPGGGIAPWDFHDLEPTAPLDTSGTAAAARALLLLADQLSDATRSEKYRRHALLTINALMDRVRDGQLVDGCYQQSLNKYTSHELIWGDFYLLQSLYILAEKMSPRTL